MRIVLPVPVYAVCLDSRLALLVCVLRRKREREQRGRERRVVGTEEACEPRAEADCAANYLNARIYLTTADVGQDRRREATAGDGDEAGDGVGEGLGYVRTDAGDDSGA